jgi:hypothetical protein
MFSTRPEPSSRGLQIHKVLIDGGSKVNVLFTKTLKKMKLDIISMLTIDGPYNKYSTVIISRMRGGYNKPHAHFRY